MRHNARTMKMFKKTFKALNSGIGKLANLFGIEFFPFLGIHMLIKSKNIERIDEIDKRVADIAAILKIYWQVEKVILH